MKLATAAFHSNIPEGAIIYGKFTQPFGEGVLRSQAIERLETIIENNGPNAYCSNARRLAFDLVRGLDWPTAGCEVTFYLYALEG